MVGGPHGRYVLQILPAGLPIADSTQSAYTTISSSCETENYTASTVKLLYFRARHDTARHSTAGHGAVRQGTTRYDATQHSTTGHSKERRGRVTLYDRARHSTAGYGTERHGTAWHGKER